MIKNKLISSFILKNISDGISNGSFPATALLVDMRGFTRLTDQAMHRIEGGAEWISNILSASFSPFIQFVQQEGGFIAEFEGDASLAIFPGNRPELLKKANELLEQISNQVGEEIEFSAASSSGDVNWGVGGSSGLLYQLFHGASISSVFNLNKDIPATTNWKFTKEESSRFFPNSLLKKKFGGEFRTVFPAFLSLEVSTIEQTQSFFHRVCELAASMNGFLNGTHLRGHEASVLIVFGAPKAMENDARRCGELVTSIRKDFPNLKAGITAGTAYAGFIGSGERCDYTVLGSRINLAARLCSAAHAGEILVNMDYGQLIQQFFLVEQAELLSLKGFTDLQLSFRVSDFTGQLNSNLYNGLFVGRTAEVQTILNLFNKSILQKKLFVLNIFGEPGIGKSRLLHEILKNLPEDVFSICLSGDELMSSRRLYSWKEVMKQIPESLLMDLFQKAKNTELDSDLEWALKYLVQLVSDTENVSISFENMIYSISLFLKVVAYSGKFFIGIQNPESLDPESLQILDSFIGNSENSSVIIVTTCRKSHQLPDFLRAENHFNLKPFSIQETKKKLFSDTGFPVRLDVAENLHLRSAGNPLYLEELSRMVQQDQMDGTWSTWHDMEQLLPASLGSLLESRIDHLSDELREAVAVASVLGIVFESQILKHMLPIQSNSITKGLSLGLWRLAGYGKLAFKHHLLKDASYKMLLVSTRKKIHRDAADTILKLHVQPEGEILVSLAVHAAKADYAETAQKYLESAGDYCRKEHQNQLAIDLYTELEHFCENPNTGMRARGKKGAVLEIVGRWKEAIDIYKISIEIADTDPGMFQHSGRMRISLGRLLMQQGFFDQAITVLQEAEAILSSSHKTVLATVYANLGGCWLRKHCFDKAECYLQQWRDISEKAGDKHSLAMVMGALGVLAEETGKMEQAKKYYLSQADIAEQIEEDFILSISMLNLGSLALVSGDLDMAESYYQKKLLIAKKLGHRSGESLAMGSLSRVYCYRKDFAKALEYASFHLKVSQVLSDRFREIPAMFDVFIVLLYSGDYSKAQKLINTRKLLVESLALKEEIRETYYLIGLLEMFKKNLKQAIHWFKLSVEYAEINHLNFDILCYSLLGLSCVQTGDILGGKRFLNEIEESILEPPSEALSVIERLLSYACSNCDPVLAERVKQQFSIKI